MDSGQIDLRFYTLDSKGHLVFEFSVPLSHYGACPSVGDIVSLKRPMGDVSFNKVLRRYLVDPGDYSSQGWCIILEVFPGPAECKEVFEEWESLTRWSREIDAKEAEEHQRELREQLDRILNKKPAADKPDAISGRRVRSKSSAPKVGNPLARSKSRKPKNDGQP